MVFQIDFKTGKPVYLQLVDQVRYAAASGGLQHGEALPSIGSDAYSPGPMAEEETTREGARTRSPEEVRPKGQASIAQMIIIGVIGLLLDGATRLLERLNTVKWRYVR